MHKPTERESFVISKLNLRIVYKEWAADPKTVTPYKPGSNPSNSERKLVELENRFFRNGLNPTLASISALERTLPLAHIRNPEAITKN